MVPHKPGGRRIILVILFLLTTIALILIFVPWQQVVEGRGIVGVFDAMSRPQNIEAPIPARLVEWKVQEGEVVTEGQVIARIQDIEQRFLDPEQPKLVAQRMDAQRRRKGEETTRAQDIELQIAQLRNSRVNAIAAAEERIKQAQARRGIAEQSLKQAQVFYEQARKVAVENAKVQRDQARDRVAQAEQALGQAKIALEGAKVERDTVKRLFDKELRSGLDMNRADVTYGRAVNQVEIADKAVEVAKKDVNRTELQIKQTLLDVDRLKAGILAAQENLNAVDREIAQLRSEAARITADTQATINGAEANLRTVRASINQIDDTLNDQEATLRNLKRRVEQQDIVAPRDGRIVRLGKVGAGETVKAGDVLAVLAPATTDQAVEMTLNGFDAPLVAVGRKVRIQFNGYPALQITGFPQVAVGTFAGYIANIDPIDDGTGRIRVWVKPDMEAVEKQGDQPWPPSSQLRPGTDAIAWVMLDTVPLGYELWRQFNGFPPSVRQVPANLTKEEKGSSDKGEKSDSDKAPKSGDIKRPKP
jgi:multidrug resistance efflux pump